jgi:hypothetical protein
MTKKPKGRNKDHDIFIKGILSLNELVLLLLYKFLPEDLQGYVDFNTLKLLTDTHINNKLLVKYSDSIHECELLREKLPKSIRDIVDLPFLRFCFLWEHKSSKPDSYIEAQVEPYRYAIVDLDKKNKRHPSIVIPILLYHGATAWDQKMLFDQFKDILEPDLLSYIPHPKYIVIDIQAMKEIEIEKMVDLGVLRAAFLTLKNADNKNFFKQDMEKALKFVEELPTEYVFQSFFQMLLEYMERRSGLEAAEFEDIVEQKLNKNMATSVKTMFDVREERKGRLVVLRGLWRGFAKKDLADLSELSDDEVEKLSTAFNQVKTMWQKKDFEHKVIPNLSVQEVNYLLELFEKKI